MSLDISALLGHENRQIKDLAERAQRYKAQLDAIEITKAEYDQLCRQLLSLEAIDEAADDAETRKQIQQAVEILRTFLGFVV